MTQLALAEKLDVTPTYLSAVESGRREPSLPLVREACKALKTPPEVLFWEAVEPTAGMTSDEKKILAQAKVLLRYYHKAL